MERDSKVLKNIIDNNGIRHIISIEILRWNLKRKITIGWKR